MADRKKVFLLNPVLRDGTQSLRIGRCQGKVMVGLWPNVEYGQFVVLLERADFEWKTLDANHAGMAWEAMVKSVVAAKPDIVFILSITAAVPDDIVLGQTLLQALPDVRVVYWGTHATVRPEDFLKSERILTVRGEVELTGQHLCRALRDGATSFEDVSGVSWLQDGEMKSSGERPLDKTLDAIPFPNHAAIGTGTHMATDTQEPFALINTSRGCPYPCVYCTAPTFHGTKWRPRSPESIIEEIQHIKATTGVTDFFFQSDLFNKDKKWTLELCALLKEKNLGITWFSNSRVNTVDEEILVAMKGAGCRLVAFGTESGSQRMLKEMGKGATVDQARFALETCRKIGLPSLTYWVMGLPGETPESLADTVKFVDEVQPDYAHFYTPTALPGTRLYEQMETKGKLDRGELNNLEFFQGATGSFITPEIPAELVQKTVRKLYFRFYTKPARVIREVKRLRNLGNVWGRLGTLGTMFKNYAIRKDAAR